MEAPTSWRCPRLIKGCDHVQPSIPKIILISAEMEILSINAGGSNLSKLSYFYRFKYPDSLPSEPLGHYILSTFL
jgi:hypothetical protein